MTFHLTDDQLNAHLDGEGQGEAASHLAGCGDCEAKLAGLRAAQAAVAAPVPPPPAAARDAAIAAALDAWGTDSVSPAEGDGAGPAPIPLRPPRRALPRALVAAAVLVVAGLAAVPFLRLGDDDPSVSTAARDELSAKAGGSVPVDLGEFDSDTALHDRLRTVLGVSGPAAASDAEAFTALGDASGAETLSGSPDQSGRAAVSDRAATGSAATKTLAACQPGAASFAGQEHTTLAFSASLVYRGTPGYVFVFIQQDGELLTRRAVVVDRSACLPLVVQSF